METKFLRYLMILDSPPKEMGYWSKGIEVTGPGNHHMEEAEERGWRGDIGVLRREHQSLITEMIDAGVPLVVLPYPKADLFAGVDSITQDIEFLRDPAISGRDGKGLLLRMGAPKRIPEVRINQAFYEGLGVPAENMKRGSHEGGNTRCLEIDGVRWYFSGTSERSDQEGLTAVTEFLGSNGITRHVHLNVTDGLHVDCIFTGIVSADNKTRLFAWMDGFTSASRKTLERTARDIEAELHPLERVDAERLAPNLIQWGHHVFSTGRFNGRKQQQAAEDGVKLHITPLTQNLPLGGAIHCLTRELFTKDPLIAARITRRLQATGFFPDDSRVFIHNNYGI